MSFIDNAVKLKESINAARNVLTDEQAIDSKWMYDSYIKLVEQGFVTRDPGYRFTHKDKLWKTIQPVHIFDGQWEPGEPGTESLYAEVAKPGEGTHDNPIIYNNNMELIEELYYTQFGVLYYCFRSTGVPVYNNLSDLIDLYVRVSN